MELVKERSAISKNPRVHLIYSLPKAGKTTIVSSLPDHYIIETEPGGANYISGRIHDVKKPSEFNSILQFLLTSPKMLDYLIIDTISRLDEWSEIVGTYNYMEKPQGKKFNRVGQTENGNRYMHKDVEWESVHSLGQGYGYNHSRQVMIDWLDTFIELVDIEKVKGVILLAHVKDKYIESSRTGDPVEVIDINLTGKVKTIYASKVDAIGHFYRFEGKGYINYDNEDNVICGGRCSHLEGKIVISEKTTEGIKTYWDRIYLK